MRLALFQPHIPQNLGAALALGVRLGVSLDLIEPCGFPLGARDFPRRDGLWRQGRFLVRRISHEIRDSQRLTASATALAEALRQTSDFPSAAESG